MSLEQEALRGKQAQEILENPIYLDAYQSVRTEILRSWEHSRDAADREQLHQLLGLLGKVQTAMMVVMNEGVVANAQLGRKATKAEQMAAYSIR
jgi:hypothetical protein